MTKSATVSGSFFNSRTNPPWDLPDVLHALKQDTRKRPFPNYNGVQSTIGRLKRYSGERNAPRGLRRFLTCYRVIVKDESTGKVYFDSRQGEILLDACKKGQDVVLPSESLDDQLERLEADYVRCNADEPSQKEMATVEQTEYPPDDELEALTRPQIAAVKSDEPAEEIVQNATPKRVMVPVPVPATAPTPTQTPKALRTPRPVPSIGRVLYLTPLEAVVWKGVVDKARTYSANSWRLGVPREASTLYSRWRPASLECDEDELYAALQRFVDNGVLKNLGDTRGNQNTFTLFFDPDWTEVREIESRAERVVTAEQLTLLRNIQNMGDSTRVGRELAKELGIVGFDERVSRSWVCVKGFEKVELVLPETVAPAPQPIPARTTPALASVRASVPRPVSAPVRALPSPTPSESTSAEVMRSLTSERDELQCRIEAAQADIATWTVQRAALDAKLKLHQDAIRQEALKRKAALAAQQAALAAQQAELDRELANLGNS